jgi:hypothetical protein
MMDTWHRFFQAYESSGAPMKALRIKLRGLAWPHSMAGGGDFLQI